MGRRVVGFLTVLAACGCRSGSVVDRPPATPGPDLFGFVPGKTTPERRAKLEAARQQLDNLFGQSVRDGRATGVAAGIVIDGELVYSKTFGVRDVASKAPVDADTVFRIASMTKSFAAMAIIQLRDEGRLRLDAPAADYIPELRTFVGATRDAPPITVRMLLTHASGIGFDDWWGAETYGTSDEQLTRMLQSGLVLTHGPGTRYQYSNLGYALLGRIVERVSGTPFRDYVTARILRPLGMTSSVWEARDVAPGHLALGYWRQGEQLRPEGNPSGGTFAAAGGLYTSLRDYARYVAFNLAAYPPRDDPETGPLRRASLREMHEGQRWMRFEDRDAPITRPDGTRVGSYGYGWLNVTNCAYEGIVQHGGYEPGYFANVALLPRHRIGIFVLATTERVWFGDAIPILREAGLLSPSPEAAPHPALADAMVAVDGLRDHWDPARAAALFDAQSLRFGWMASLREELAGLGSAHGRCHHDGAPKTYGPLRALWKLACERGTIEFDATMTPVVPPRVQYLTWTEELPAEPEALEYARVLMALLRTWDEGVAVKLFGMPTGGTRKTMARIRDEHGLCDLAAGVRRVERPSFGAPAIKHMFRLRCDDGENELEVGRSAAGSFGPFFVRRPRDPDALCWR